MRIAFVAFHGSIHTRRWVQFFADRGHEVHVITLGGAGPFTGDDHVTPASKSYEVHDLGAMRHGRMDYLLRAPAARRVLRRIRPDVVHGHYVTSYGLLARLSGVRPLVITGHGDDILLSPAAQPMRGLVAGTLRAASLITVPSEQMAAATRKLLGNTERPIGVFQYGVDAARLEERGDALRAELPQREPDAPLTLVNARPMYEFCHSDTLILALAELTRRGVAWRCVWLGTGPERDRVLALAAETGVDAHIDFAGHVSPVETERHLAQADLYVSLADHDGASIGLLEAMALGTVPVLSDNPANTPWISERTGALVDELDPVSVADGIVHAAGLDHTVVIAANRAAVAARADRATNLTHCEALIEAVVAGSD